MALTYGFFNSLNGDRTYNADQMSSMFEGLISEGVYESVDNAFIVTPSSGLTLSVGSGRAIVGEKWVKNDADTTITLNAAHVTLNRYTAIVLRKDIANRQISIEMIDGENASNPTKPSILRNSSYYDLCLAYVYVASGATAITSANITDMRPDSTVCGWVTGLIEQVDTSQLFLQWQTAYSKFYNQMQSWQSNMRLQFNTWFEALTDKLQINTYIEQYHKYVELASSDSKIVALDMAGYTYDSSDVFIIAMNGLVATETKDYSIDTSTTPAKINLNFTDVAGSVNQSVDIKILKSKIGYSQKQINKNQP